MRNIARHTSAGVAIRSIMRERLQPEHPKDKYVCKKFHDVTHHQSLDREKNFPIDTYKETTERNMMRFKCKQKKPGYRSTRWQSWVLRKQIKVTLHQLKRTIATTWENLLYKTVLPCGRDMEQNMRNRHQHRPGFSKRKNIECPRCKSFRNDGANMCSKFVLTSFQPLSLSAVMRSVPFRQWMCQHILKEWVLLTGRRLIRRQPLVPLLFVLKFWTTCVIKLVVIWFALAQ